MPAAGKTVSQIVEALGVGEQTINRRRNPYGGMKEREPAAATRKG